MSYDLSDGRATRIVNVIPDPNWLYSTIVQASAAAVAILAGFTITRIVANRSEIDRNIFRLAILKPEIARVEKVKSQAEMRRIGDQTPIYLKGALEYLELNPLASDDAIKDSFEEGQVKLTEDEIDRILSKMHVYLEEARTMIPPLLKNNVIPQVNEMQLKRLGFDLNPEEAVVYLFVLKEIRAKKTQWMGERPLLGVNTNALTEWYENRFAIDSLFYDGGKDSMQEKDANESLGKLLLEESTLEADIQVRTQMVKLRWFYTAITTLTLFGIVVPAFFMTRRPVPISPSYRNFTLVMFFIAIGLSAYYIFDSLQHKKHAPDSNL
jgi:hypothetical protein